jgi:hypothetical protein
MRLVRKITLTLDDLQFRRVMNGLEHEEKECLRLVEHYTKRADAARDNGLSFDEETCVSNAAMYSEFALAASDAIALAAKEWRLAQIVREDDL